MQKLKFVQTAQNGVSVATTGVKASYTVPGGKQARLVQASVRQTGAAGVIELQLVTAAGDTYTLETSGVGADVASTSFTGLCLDAGDVVRWNVTTLDAGNTGDFLISAEEITKEL